jgi:hypothetical protein
VCPSSRPAQSALGHTSRHHRRARLAGTNSFFEEIFLFEKLLEFLKKRFEKKIEKIPILTHLHKVAIMQVNGKPNFCENF